MSDSPADHIKDYLEANGFTVPIFVGTEPAEPEFCITIYDTGGSHANQDAGLQDPTIQIRGRGLNYGELYTTISSMRDLLIRPTSRFFSTPDSSAGRGWFYTGFWLVSDVAKIGRDDNNRELMVVNFRSMRQLLPVDKGELVAAVECALSLVEGYYTPESWAALPSTIAIAEAVVGDVGATQSQVDLAADDLMQAMLSLVTISMLLDFENSVFAIADQGELNG